MRNLRIVLSTLIFLITTAHAADRLPTAEPLPINMLESNIAYVKIGQFTADLVPRIRPTLQKVTALKPRGVILDFRNNQGGNVEVVQAILDALLPKGTPYMRHVTPVYRRIVPTTQAQVLKKSTPVVVLRDARTVNEADIAIYALHKLRGAGVIEFSPTRGALKRAFKQHARMEQYRPIKEAVFFVSPDDRVIASERGDQQDVIVKSITYIREHTPWDKPKTAGKP